MNIGFNPQPKPPFASPSLICSSANFVDTVLSCRVCLEKHLRRRQGMFIRNHRRERFAAQQIKKHEKIWRQNYGKGWGTRCEERRLENSNKLLQKRRLWRARDVNVHLQRANNQNVKDEEDLDGEITNQKQTARPAIWVQTFGVSTNCEFEQYLTISALDRSKQIWEAFLRCKEQNRNYLRKFM